MKKPHHTGLLFAGVVTFLLVLVGWWIYFLVRESFRLDEATQLAARGDLDGALQALGAAAGGDFSDKARQYRVMFPTEGMAIGLLLLAGVFMLYRALLRESRLRTDQERFLTGATHRLKTPLATVRLGIESIRAGSMPAGKKEHYLSAMLREIDRLENDITNLLTAGGLESSGDGIRLVQGDLSEDVRAAAEVMQDRFDAADIRFEKDIAPALSVHRDAAAVRLIVHNLLDNAAKYSTSGDKVELELSRQNGHARLVVRDTGRGIPNSELPRIFDRFYSGTVQGHKGGSGIGLYLVRQLVDTHDGSVTAHSEGEDRGTKVEVRIPIAGEPG